MPFTRAELAEWAIGRPHPADSIGGVVRNSALSSRRFVRLFGDQTGFPPKVFARLLRSRRAVQALHREPDKARGNAAQVCGYFDQ